MEIRQATVDDLPAVEQFRLDAFSGADDSAWRGVPPAVQLRVRLALWERARNALPGVLVAVDGGRLVGTAAVDTVETAAPLTWRRLLVLRHLGPVRGLRTAGVWVVAEYRPAPDEGYLHDAMVDPAYRQRGVARALTVGLEDLARAWGKRFAVSEVSRDNVAPLRLFASLGYRVTEPTRRNLVRRLLQPTPSYVRVEKRLDPSGEPCSDR
jgi:ribosomal protein S18 acetylase RimI-like enzyme